MKKYRVYQTISIFVEAENEVEAVKKVRSDENTYLGWDKWNTEGCDSIIDFYPPLNKEVDTIEMPVYYYDEESGEKVYDFEEMADVLENRICKYLNRKVSITISEEG